MKARNIAGDIKYLRIDLVGSGYTGTLDDKVKASFREDAIEAVVRGQHAPAAGPELWMDVVIAIGSDLAVEGIKYAVRKVRDAISESSSRSCCVNKTTVEDFDCECDFVIQANSAAGMIFEEIELTSIVTQMRELVESEKASGRYISKIEAPCDLGPCSISTPIRSVGVGSYSLWLLSYREGERCPYWLYDVVNEVFIPLDDNLATTNALNASDIFYAAK